MGSQTGNYSARHTSGKHQTYATQDPSDLIARLVIEKPHRSETFTCIGHVCERLYKAYVYGQSYVRLRCCCCYLDRRSTLHHDFALNRESF